MPVHTELPPEPLVKHSVADCLGKEIASGALRPGMPIVEGTWARKLGVAQGSIREAINLLAQDGFVCKKAGRSARVVSLSEKDVLQMYELRGALEGLAARLAAENATELTPLDDALAIMRHSLKNGDPDKMLDADLRFHLELCRLSGNSFVLEHARRVLLPLFAFARIRIVSSGQSTSVWEKDIEPHQRIIDLVKEGHGEIAEQYVRHAMSRFAQTAYDNWKNKSPTESLNRSSR